MPTIFVLAHWDRDQMAVIFLTTFSNAFFFMKMYQYRLKFHWSSFFPKGPINKPALVQIMAWRRPGDIPLSEPMMIRLPTHICVTRPQLVDIDFGGQLAISNMTCAQRLWLAIPAIITTSLRVLKYVTRCVFEVTRYVIHVTRNLNYVTRFLS